MRLVLHDHRALQSAALRASLAGAATTCAFALLSPALAAAVALFALAVAACPPRRAADLAVAGVVACAAAAALDRASGLGPPVALGAFGWLYARDLAGGASSRLLAAAFGAAGLGAALVVGTGLAHPLEGLVGAPLGGLLAGAAAGQCARLGAVGRELRFAPALPAPAVAAPLVLSSCDSADSRELGELLRRAGLACDGARGALGAEAPAAARAAADLLGRISAFATRWRELDRQLAGLDRAGLVERAGVMDERAAAATAAEVDREYRRAGAAIRQQVADFDAIRSWRDRSLARLHHHVAVLERLRLAALHRSSVATDESGDALGGLVDEIASAGLELDGAAELQAALPG